MKKLIGLLAFVMLVGIGVSNAQTKQVTGTVTDKSDGSPLPGVSVAIKGTNQGTATDINGKFTIKVSPKDVLVFSFVGMEKQEITVGDKKVINVKMESGRVAVEEVVVMAYGTQKKGSVAGSVNVVKEDVLKDVPVASVDQMLQGKTSGVDIVANSGNPGATAKIVIRGTGSISASTAPLIIVDGMPTNGVLSTINTNDIESVTTLKDASAVALYGARAANGVLLITTKQGKKGDMKISYSGTYGFVDALIDNYEMMNSKELLMYQRDILKAGKGFQLKDDAAGYAELEGINTDWKDEMFRTGIIHTHNLSIKGGTDKAHFYLGANKYDEEGVIKAVYFERKGITFNADMQGRDWLQVGTNINIQNTKSREARTSRNALNPFQYIYSALPWEKMFNDDGTYNKTSSTVNPLENTVNNPDITEATNFIGSVWTKIDFTDEIKMTSRAGITRLMTEWNGSTKKGSHLYDAIYDDRKQETYRRYTTYLLNSVLSYTKTFNNLHDLSAKAIIEYQKYDNRKAYMAGKGFPTAALDNLASAAEPLAAESTIEEWALMSYMANVKYVFDQKYICDLSLRRDGSSRFGKDSKYGNFWAVGLAWNAHKELFIQDIDFINQLKVRASIGTSGNDKVGYYDHLPLVGFGKYNNLPAGELTNIGNPDLKWEKTLQTSLGVDFALLNNKITGTIEVYEKRTSDLLLEAQLSRTTGFESITKNVGEVKNRGLEFMVNATPIEINDFRWDVGFNIYTNKSTVEKLSDGNDIKTGYNILREGEEMLAYYMNRYAGVNTATGQILFYDKDGNVTDTRSSDDRVLLNKSPFADYAGNITTDFRYKGFALGMNFYFKQGHYMYNIASSNSHDVSNSTGNVHRDILTQAWQKPGDIATYPVPNENTETPWGTTLYLEDASYVRLRDINLSYTLPSSFLKKYKIDRLTLSVRGHNLWTYAPNFHGPDPEIGDGGEEDVSGFGTVYDYTYPSTKSITFGLEITF